MTVKSVHLKCVANHVLVISSDFLPLLSFVSRIFNFENRRIIHRANVYFNISTCHIVRKCNIFFKLV